MHSLNGNKKELSKNADLITSFLHYKNFFIASYAFRIKWQLLRVIRGPCACSACYCSPPSLTFHHLHTFNSFVCAAPLCAWAFALAVSFASTYQYHLPLLWLILSFKSQLRSCLIQKPFLDSRDWGRRSFCDHTPLVLTTVRWDWIFFLLHWAVNTLRQVLVYSQLQSSA